jgi:hypothetical protein
VPLVGVLGLPTVWMVPIGLFATAALLWSDRWRSPLAPGAAVVGVTAVPHGLMAWHTDGMETARHLVVPGMQLRLAVLLLGVALLAPVGTDPGEPTEPATGPGETADPDPDPDPNHVPAPTAL